MFWRKRALTKKEYTPPFFSKLIITNDASRENNTPTQHNSINPSVTLMPTLITDKKAVKQDHAI